jgi:hypothetical protein
LPGAGTFQNPKSLPGTVVSVCPSRWLDQLTDEGVILNLKIPVITTVLTWFTLARSAQHGG